jgi:hypothetical protein
VLNGSNGQSIINDEHNKRTREEKAYGCTYRNTRVQKKEQRRERERETDVEKRTGRTERTTVNRY